MGNRASEAGVEIRQGHFANHHFQMCPNDPASQWPYGTRIDTDTGIAQHSQSGAIVYYTTFYLYDTGDYSCSQGGYWVDIYFGRWETKPVSDPTYCYCSGVVSPGFCYSGIVSSCADAESFFPRYYWYTGP